MTPALQMGASSITPNVSVKTLGGIFDKCINMYEHVTSVWRAAYYHLKNVHCLKYDHINPILQKLHWLPVRQRINFKILSITYKSINDMAPEYLCEFLSIRKSSRKLRSSSQMLLQVPVCRLKSCGDCAFSVASPTLWNRLPADIRNASSFDK